MFIFLIISLTIPTYALPSSSTTQTVSITVPEVNGISTTYSSNDDSLVETMFMGTIQSVGQIKLTNPSNEDTEIWIKANSENNEELSNIKYYISGTDIKGELSDSYKKAVVLNKLKRSITSELDLNIYIHAPYNVKSTVIYVTSIKCQNIVP
ncbi:MAG: hypothetical protein ACPK7O_05020 [Methanobacterium sp.]